MYEFLGTLVYESGGRSKVVHYWRMEPRGEQTHDRDPWGGILSTYGAVLAMYTKATDSNEFKGLAYEALNYCLYAVNDDGCPNQRASNSGRGGWQEDAHTDKLHNILDAIAAFPEWAN